VYQTFTDWRYGLATFAVSAILGQTEPPPPLRGYGATSFACHKLAWFTEPKLAEGERRMVAQNSASWNRVVLWMRQLKSLSSLMTSGFAQGLVRVSQ